MTANGGFLDPTIPHGDFSDVDEVIVPYFNMSEPWSPESKEYREFIESISYDGNGQERQ